MRILSCLQKYKNILTNPVECSFFEAGYNPSIKGQYQGYDVEFGVHITGGGRGGYHYDCYCKAKFKSPPKVPFFPIWGITLDNSLAYQDGHISGDRFVLKNNWLYVYYGGLFSLSKKGLESYLKNQTVEALQSKFNQLLEKTKRIESGSFNIQLHCQRQVNKTLKDVIVYGAIAVIVTTLVWWYLK